MSHHALGTSTDFSTLKINEGETLVAHWLRDPINNPVVAVVEDENHFNTIVAKAGAGYYNELKFFATTNFTENPYAYEELHGDSNEALESPTIEGLIAKALDAGVIDDDFAQRLRASSDIVEVLGEFYAHVILEDRGDPTELLRSWGIADPQK